MSATTPRVSYEHLQTKIIPFGESHFPVQELDLRERTVPVFFRNTTSQEGYGRNLSDEIQSEIYDLTTLLIRRLGKLENAFANLSTDELGDSAKVTLFFQLESDAEEPSLRADVIHQYATREIQRIRQLGIREVTEVSEAPHPLFTFFQTHREESGRVNRLEHPRTFQVTAHHQGTVDLDHLSYLEGLPLPHRHAQRFIQWFQESQAVQTRAQEEMTAYLEAQSREKDSSMHLEFAIR